MSTHTIDQDELCIKPIVHWGAGEVVGNMVTISIRDFDEVFKWFARVDDPGGYTTADTGLEGDFNEAVHCAMSSVMKALGARAEDE